MKLNPLEIEHAEFPQTFRGYKKAEVRNLLAMVADKIDSLQQDNQQLLNELSKRDEQIESLLEAENELRRAVIAAERVATEIKHNANREAELVVKEAKNIKDSMIKDAEARLKEAHFELSRLEKEYQLFREQFRGILKAFERSLDSSLSSINKNPEIETIDFNKEYDIETAS